MAKAKGMIGYKGSFFSGSQSMSVRLAKSSGKFWPTFNSVMKKR